LLFTNSYKLPVTVLPVVLGGYNNFAPRYVLGINVPLSMRACAGCTHCAAAQLLRLLAA